MRTFSLHKLRARQFPYEHTFQDLLQKEGYPSVQHELVHVFVNGDDWGVMDMQEHFTTEMLEKNGLKASSIFRLSDDQHWLAYSGSQSQPLGADEYWLSNPRIFVELLGKNSKKLREQRQLQLSYVRSRLKERDYFPVLFDKNMIDQAALILGVWGNFHPISLHNSRFYLNPFTLKLQPLIADQGPFEKLGVEGWIDPVASYTNGAINSENYGAVVNDPERINSVVRGLTELAAIRNQQSQFPGDAELNLTVPKENALLIREKDYHQLDPSAGYSEGKLNCEGKSSYHVGEFDSVFASFGDGGILSVIPLHCQKLEIISIAGCGAPIKINKVIRTSEIDIATPTNIEIPELFFPSWLKSPDLPYRRISNQVHSAPGWQVCQDDDLSLTYNSGGQIKTTKILVNHFIPRDKNPLLASRDIGVEFIRKRGPEDYFIEEGDWEVQGPLLIKGNLFIGEGATISFSQNAYLIIDGSLVVQGTVDKPVLFQARVPGEFWRGLYILGSERKSVSVKIEHAHFDEMKNLSDGLLQLTGAITIYNGSVEIRSVKISNTTAEDALNIVRSSVTVNDLSISETKSDAFDCDFCEGDFNAMSFNAIGGDGFDVSGSKFTASIKSAFGIHDKVVSVGERSSGSISIDEAKNSYVAVAVKDAGNAQIRLQNTHTIGPLVMAYIKKDFYEGKTNAVVELGRSVFSNHSAPFVAAKNTRLLVDGISTPTKMIDVDELYSSGPMKKN